MKICAERPGIRKPLPAAVPCRRSRAPHRERPNSALALGHDHLVGGRKKSSGHRCCTSPMQEVRMWRHRKSRSSTARAPAAHLRHRVGNLPGAPHDLEEQGDRPANQEHAVQGFDSGQEPLWPLEDDVAVAERRKSNEGKVGDLLVGIRLFGDFCSPPVRRASADTRPCVGTTVGDSAQTSPIQLHPDRTRVTLATSLEQRETSDPRVRSHNPEVVGSNPAPATK